jgi:hypothetical protein
LVPEYFFQFTCEKAGVAAKPAAPAAAVPASIARRDNLKSIAFLPIVVRIVRGL